MAKILRRFTGYAGKQAAVVLSTRDRAFLDAVIILIGHENVGMFIDGHIRRGCKLRIAGAVFAAAQLHFVNPITVENLDAVVAAVCHVEVTIDRADCDCLWTLELA